MSRKKSPAPIERGPGPAAGKVLVNTSVAGSTVSTVTFGAVTVSSATPDAPEFLRNIASGQAALARAAPKLVKPGVTVKRLASVPFFRADPKNPSHVIRVLNGETVTGRFVSGKFRALSPKR